MREQLHAWARRDGKGGVSHEKRVFPPQRHPDAGRPGGTDGPGTCAGTGSSHLASCEDCRREREQLAHVLGRVRRAGSRPPCRQRQAGCDGQCTSAGACGTNG
ncbi:MAG: hypothetical protein MZV64_04535 [Ignavibacteriales bacterium]|nr:hypothetical protein [Ignavibacteriales bacterium]